MAMIAAFGAPYGGLMKPLQGEPRTMSAAAERQQRRVRERRARRRRNGLARTRSDGRSPASGARWRGSVCFRRVTVVTGWTHDIRYFSVEGAKNYVYSLKNGLFEPFADLASGY